MAAESDMENLGDAEKLGAAIKNARKSMGVSQDYVATVAFDDLSRKSDISRLEGAKNPAVTPETVRKVATALRIDPADIPECYRWPEAIALLIARESSTAINAVERARMVGHEPASSDSTTPAREPKQIDSQEFPPKDLRLTYENLDWDKHWLSIVRFAAKRGNGEVRRKVYDALANLTGAQARRLIEDHIFFIDIDVVSFNDLSELKIASSQPRGPSIEGKIFILILFMLLLYLGISLVGSKTGLRALEAITPAWFGEFFVFVPIVAIGVVFWGLCMFFGNVLFNPALTEKSIMLTEIGEEFMQSDLKPAFTEYLRENRI